MKFFRLFAVCALLAGSLVSLADYTTNAPGVHTVSNSVFTTDSPTQILPFTAPPRFTNIYVTNGVFVLQGISIRSGAIPPSSSFIDVYAKSNTGGYGLYESISLTTNYIASFSTTPKLTNTSLSFSNWSFKLQYDYTNSGTVSRFSSESSFLTNAPVIAEDTNTHVDTMLVTWAGPSWFTNGAVLEVWTNAVLKTSLAITNKPLNGSVSTNNYEMMDLGISYSVRLRNGSLVTPFSNPISLIPLSAVVSLDQNAADDWSLTATWNLPVSATVQFEVNIEGGGWTQLFESPTLETSGYNYSFDPVTVIGGLGGGDGDSVQFRVTLTDSKPNDATSVVIGPFTIP